MFQYKKLSKYLLTSLLALAVTLPVMADPTGASGGTDSSGGDTDTNALILGAVVVGAGITYWKYGPRQASTGSQVAPAKTRMKVKCKKVTHIHKANRLTKSKVHSHCFTKPTHKHRYAR